MSETSQWDRLRAGDGTAFDEIARQHGLRLRAVAGRLLGCSEAAAEVVQDVLFRLWRDRESLIIREHLGGYLARAVRNRALDHLKRRRLESRWLERALIEVDWAHTDRLADARSHPPNVDLVDGDVYDALDRLPARRREAVLLRWRDGLSYAEIAARLDISVKTVENQIGRGLKTLRETLRGWNEVATRAAT